MGPELRFWYCHWFKDFVNVGESDLFCCVEGTWFMYKISSWIPCSVHLHFTWSVKLYWQYSREARSEFCIL